MGDHPDAAAHGAPLQGHRQQNQRCSKAPLVLLVALPKQEAEGEVERVRAALLQRGLRLAVGLDGALAQFVLRQIGEHAGFVELGAKVLGAQGFVRKLAPRRCLALGGRRAWQRTNIDPGAVGQLVFEQRRVRAEDVQAGARAAVVQQRIPSGEVQELSLPAFEAALGRLRLLLGGRQIVEVRQNRRGLQSLPRHFRLRVVFVGSKRPRHPQRTDALQTSLANVDGGDEVCIALVVQLSLRLFDGRGKARRRAAGDEGGLEQQQLAEVHALAQRLRVVHDHAGQLFRLQPNADHGVLLRHGHDRIESGLLESGSEQHRRVQARGDLAFQDRARQPHLLPLLLEAGWRQHVAEAEVGDRRVDG